MAYTSSDEIVKRVGEQVLFYRRQSGLSQEALAHECGLNPAQVGQIERGMKNVTLKTLGKIAAGLHIELRQLFDFEVPVVSANDQALAQIRHSLASLNDKEAAQLAQIVQDIVALKK